MQRLFYRYLIKCLLAYSCCSSRVCEVTLLTGVCLTLLGRAKVHWTVRRSKNSRTHYRAEEIYINEQVYLFGSRTSVFFILSFILNVTTGLSM